MKHDEILNAFCHLLKNSTDQRSVLDQLFWRAWELGVDAGIELERGNERGSDERLQTP